MERLKEKIIRRKTDVFEYRMIKRNEYVAFYAQWYTDCDKPRIVSYEVFMIRKREAGTVRFAGVDVSFTAKETFPVDEDFGFTAWSIVDVKEAEARFEKLSRLAQLNHGKKKVTT